MGKSILDPNMLCQERQPPCMKALSSQRIRWETAGLQMRRTFNWIWRSRHYSRLEALVLFWTLQKKTVPFQTAPYQLAKLLPTLVLMSGMRTQTGDLAQVATDFAMYALFGPLAAIHAVLQSAWGPMVALGSGNYLLLVASLTLIGLLLLYTVLASASCVYT